MNRKKVTAYFPTGGRLIPQTFEIDEDFSIEHLAGPQVEYVTVYQVGRGNAMVRLDSVAFWTYD